MSQILEIKVPDIGGNENVDVIDVMVKVGDTVKVDDALITLETEKATMDVPADAAGRVTEVRVKTGDKVSEGSVIVLVEAAGDAAVSAPPTVAAVAEQAPAAPAGKLEVTVTVPDIGGHQNVDVIEVMVKVGDTVKVDDALITLETDKATMDVPSTAAGVIGRVLVKVGDKVSAGSPIIEVAATANTAAAAAAPAPVAAAPVQAASHGASPKTAYGNTPVNESIFNRGHAGPAVRKLARELGVDLTRIKGTGRRDRVVASDVKAFVKNLMQNPAAGSVPSLGGGLDLLPWPKVDFSKFGDIETIPLSRIKKISGQNLARNWVMIPHVTQHDDADMTELEAFRQTLNQEWAKAGIKFSPLAFIIKACVKALQTYPDFNASLDGENLVVKKYIHIGFAADTPNGLVVPVIRDADKKGLRDIAIELTELSQKAREGKLKPQEMQGASFTISSLGGIGGTYFTPIINAPEVAILGVCKAQTRPVWNGKKFTPRLMCPLSLSYDHRVIDGAAACRFTTLLTQLLADFRRVTV
ncbi:MAG: dihydrolipoyllysine-residue acetyltransferase [Neisseria sp.]|nr:dihydrolipoyllysine-residue acetyltransferase [Neisseria sp.]